MQFDGALGQAYAQALLAIARVDREIGPEEAARVRELVAQRSDVAIDVEASFFHKITPDELATAVDAAVAGAAGAPLDKRAVGRALVSDAVALATVDGDLNSVEAQAIVRFARALCSDDDIGAETHQLDEWL